MNKFICDYPWHDIYVNHFGEISFCSNHKVFGNLKQNSLEEIYHSKEIDDIRNYILKGDYLNTRCLKTCGVLTHAYPELANYFCHESGYIDNSFNSEIMAL